MTNALVLVDLQRDYFQSGAHPLVEPDAAVAEARRVLDFWRQEHRPVVHVQHVATESGATFMRPDTDGVGIHSLVAPQHDEIVVTKHQPNAFLDTSLLDELRTVGAESITVVGMMTNMCIDATVRAASDLGFDVTVVADACAASDLQFDGRIIDGATVHAAFLAALQGTYARVCTAQELLAE
ncbi:MAG: cysteine hydrolase family protein [Nakamurella sp.]